MSGTLPRFPLGVVVLAVVSFLVYFGAAQRVLDRLRLSDRAALLLIAAAIIGSFLNIPLPAPPGPRFEASLNVGGGLLPLGLAVYLVARAETAGEKARALGGAALTGVAVYLLGLLLGAEPETMFLDPLYVYPVVGGSVAYLLGRSRRGAFVAATLGIILVDLFFYFRMLVTRTPGAVLIGGGGAFDTVVVSGLLAVLLAELVGEGRERLQGGPRLERPVPLRKPPGRRGAPQEPEQEGGEG